MEIAKDPKRISELTVFLDIYIYSHPKVDRIFFGRVRDLC